MEFKKINSFVDLFNEKNVIGITPGGAIYYNNYGNIISLTFEGAVEVSGLTPEELSKIIVFYNTPEEPKPEIDPKKTKKPEAEVEPKIKAELEVAAATEEPVVVDGTSEAKA